MITKHLRKSTSTFVRNQTTRKAKEEKLEILEMKKNGNFNTVNNKLKMKRILFIISLMILFIFCYRKMAVNHDLFARYSYITEENEDIIRKYITEPDDIDYIISQKIKPEQFMNFIELPGFTVKNILYYDICLKENPTDTKKIINFVNTYRSQFKIETFENFIKNYTYETIKNYFDNGYSYFEDADLVEDPSKLSTILDENDVLMDYTPSNLVTVEMTLIQLSPSIEGNDCIQLRSDSYRALKEMMEAYAHDDYVLYKTLSLTGGYVSYEEQIKVYDEASKKYDDDLAAENIFNNQNTEEETLIDSEKSEDTYNKEKKEALNKIVDLPGRSENQLGFTITLKINDLSDVTAIEKSEQYKWLSENAHNYGYIFRYPKDKESVTGKKYQPLTLRYVGEENSLKIHKTNKAFDEIK